MILGVSVTSILTACIYVAPLEGKGLLMNDNKTFMCDDKPVEFFPRNLLKVKELEEINFDKTKLKIVPREIRELGNLKIMSFRETEIEALPESVPELKKLQEIYLCKTKIKSLQPWIGGIKSLRKLDLSDTGVEQLPDEISGMENLLELILYSTKIRVLPDGVGRLSRLQMLGLSFTQVGSDPLPGWIGNLPNLKIIDLFFVGLRSIHASIRNLSGVIVRLDIRNNFLMLEYGVGPEFGLWELEHIFPDCLLASSSLRRGALSQDITEESVYEEMRKAPLYWDMDELKEIRKDNVQEHGSGEAEMLELFRKKFVRTEEGEDETREDGIIENYIKMLYRPGHTMPNIWSMHADSVEKTKDLLKGVLSKLAELDLEMAKQWLPVMDKVVRCFPDEQVSGLNTIYLALCYENENDDSLVHFIKQKIAFIRDYILLLAVAPRIEDQQAGVHKYWGRILGFEEEDGTEMAPPTADKFGGNPGSALNLFRLKFAVEYVRDEVMKSINMRQAMVCKAGSFLKTVCGKSERYLMRVFERYVRDDDGEFVYSGIKKDGVKDILLEIGLLVAGGSRGGLVYS